MFTEKIKKQDWLKIAVILWGVVGALCICPAGSAYVFFDSPSPNWNANYLFIYSVVAFPVVCLVSSLGIWFLKSKFKKLAFYIFLLPVLPLILIVVGNSWMNQSWQKETAVNSAACDFDGADGLQTTLCERTPKVDNFDELGYSQGTTAGTFEAHNWQFSAQQGQQITIRMSTWGGGCPAIRMRIIDSQGIVLETFDHPAPVTCTNDAPTVTMHSFDPLADDIYTLRIDTPEIPGPYWFQIID